MEALTACTRSLFMTGGSRPSKMQVAAVFWSTPLYSRGRWVEHLPKGCSASLTRTVLSWAGNFHQNSPAAQPRRKTSESKRSTSAWLQPSSWAACTGRFTACWFLLPRLFGPFTSNIPGRKTHGKTSLPAILNTFASTYFTGVLDCKLLRVALGRKNFVPNYFCPCGLNV